MLQARADNEDRHKQGDKRGQALEVVVGDSLRLATLLRRDPQNPKTPSEGEEDFVEI